VAIVTGVLTVNSLLQGAGGVSVTPAELAACAEWTAAYLGPAGTRVAFSFTYGGRPSPGLLQDWARAHSSEALDAQRTRHTTTWTDPQTGLVVRCVSVAYRDFPTVEWTLSFRNGGATDTPVLDGIQALDLAVEGSGEGEYLLHHAVGSPCTPRDYQPLESVLGPGTRQRIAAAGGRPTNTDLSYFNLEAPGGRNLIVAVGWPGQWASEWVRDNQRGLRVRAGQEQSHFKLLPGEEVRTPLIALQFWHGPGALAGGDWLRAQNLWRRWFIAHNLHRPGGRLPPTQWCGASLTTNMMVEATEENQKQYVDAYLARGLKPDFWWMDAGWYPCHGDWTCTGTWEPDPARFPHGLRPVTDYLHARGIRSILWFEPERVRRGTWLAVEHPEWVLWGDGDGLLDLGNPAAWRWLVDHVDAMLTTADLDIYRQDFNMDPLPMTAAVGWIPASGCLPVSWVSGLGLVA